MPRPRRSIRVVGTVFLAVAAGLQTLHWSFASPQLGTSAASNEVHGIGSSHRHTALHQLTASPRHSTTSTTGRTALPEVLSYIQDTIQHVPEQVAEMGPMGIVYFFAIYVVAECLALPAAPLTLSSGYLFGLPIGSLTSILAGTTAAVIGFTLSRTFLRPQISKMIEGNETFRDINKAVEREGFKIIFLLRLSPLLPFALSNYVYGLSRCGFGDFLLATALGFAPGTIGLVYAATAARDVMSDGGSQPWYVYAVGLVVTAALLKIVSDVASQAVKEAVEEDAKAAESLGRLQVVQIETVETFETVQTVDVESREKVNA